MRRMATTLVGALALATLLPAFAEQRYVGTFRDDQAYVDVTLTLPEQAGKAGARLDFRKWACFVRLGSPKPVEGALRYPIEEGGKGRCQVLDNGDMLSQATGDKLDLRLLGYNGALKYSIQLTRAPQ